MVVTITSPQEDAKKKKKPVEGYIPPAGAPQYPGGAAGEPWQFTPDNVLQGLSDRFAPMADKLAMGPQQGFTEQQLNMLRQRGMENTMGADRALKAGAAQADAARGVAGTGLAGLVGAQLNAQTRGDLAHAGLDAEIAGRELGQQDYALQNQFAGMLGDLANSQAGRDLQMLLEGVQFDPETGTYSTSGERQWGEEFKEGQRQFEVGREQWGQEFEEQKRAAGAQEREQALTREQEADIAARNRELQVNLQQAELRAEEALQKSQQAFASGQTTQSMMFDNWQSMQDAQSEFIGNFMTELSENIKGMDKDDAQDLKQRFQRQRERYVALAEQAQQYFAQSLPDGPLKDVMMLSVQSQLEQLAYDEQLVEQYFDGEFGPGYIDL